MKIEQYGVNKNAWLQRQKQQQKNSKQQILFAKLQVEITLSLAIPACVMAFTPR